MTILLSAYHCAPNLGSESAIGWNYAVQLAKLGHQVIVITSDSRKPFFDENFNSRHPGMEVIFFGLPTWIKRLYKPASISEHIYYFLWQIALYSFSKSIVAAKKIDIIHHITLGVFRVPSFLYLHKLPFVFGPVGGGEECPGQLRNSLPFAYRFKESLRTAANKIFSLNPWLYFCLKNSSIILLKTSDNFKYIPASFHHKCKVMLELGLNNISEGELKPRGNKSLKILYAGRLVYWKGVHIAIKAFASVKAKYPEIQFTIIGSGHDEDWVKHIGRQEKVFPVIDWVPKVSQESLFKMYQEYDLLLFPSLHDSSGGVVLEALAYGLPVVCLDLGGPKEIVNNTCGIIINTKRKNEKEIIKNLSAAIEYLINNPDILENMSNNALKTAAAYTWDKVVKKSYKYIMDSLTLNNDYKRRSIRN